jgi:class 3 adenylate cyclase/sensor domain CHASE-containing protein
MKTRHKYIITIIAAWVFLFSVIFIVSNYIFMTGFSTLENQLAVDNSRRVFQGLLSSVKYLYYINLDSSTWSDTYAFVKTPSPTYIKANLERDAFIDNKLNYILIFDKDNNTVWSKAFDLAKNEYHVFEPEILNYFQKNATELLHKKEKFNDLSNEKNGVSGFIKLPHSPDIAYFALNPIVDFDQKKPPNGILIYGKIITSAYEKVLSDRFSYPVQLIPLSTFSTLKDSQTILKNLMLSSNSIYTTPLDQNYLISYTLVRDFNFNPIAVLKVTFSREIHGQSKKSMQSNQFILLIFSLLGVFSMSYLVYIFFRQQELITLAFERFVPHELLQLLSKKTILEIALGDHSKRIVSILFMDIRNFTTLSEQLTPKENFDFINRLLNKVAPLISKNNGFIDKYIGDAVMAVFTDPKTHADDAVETALDIVNTLDELNATNALQMQQAIYVGIGINSGESTLGIVGAQGRMEGTVISDSVNVASRIESLTKIYGKSILISKQCYDCIQQTSKYDINYIDDVTVKGKLQKTTIYAVERAKTTHNN